MMDIKVILLFNFYTLSLIKFLFAFKILYSDIHLLESLPLEIYSGLSLTFASLILMRQSTFDVMDVN